VAPSSRPSGQSSLSRELQPTDLLSLYSAASLDHFFTQVFRLLPRIVACDYVSVFYQRVGDGFLKERDSRGRVWSRAFMRRYIELTPAIPLVLANPGVKVLPTRLGLSATEAELRRTAFYREVMQRQGWRHGVALCFWAEPAGSFPILVITLYRGEGQPDFNERELAGLESLHPFLAPAVSRFHEISVSDAISEGVATALRHVSPGVVVLDWQLRVVRTTPAGRRAFAEWNRASSHLHAEPPLHLLSVPDCLLEACHELRRELSSSSRRALGSRTRRRRYVSHPESLGLLASVTAISLGTPLAEPSFVIEFESPGGSHLNVPDAGSPLAKLTKSEAQVALVIAEGCSNEEAAERLGKSVHAVKFLLHRTYQKLGVPNRARLSLLLRRNG
jgi:DNA-binding CsgD family transcriptional regulator